MQWKMSFKHSQVFLFSREPRMREATANNAFSIKTYPRYKQLQVKS